MTISFCLMTQKGFNVLKALLEAQYHSILSKIIVGRDKQLDNDFADQIISLCKEHHIHFEERSPDVEINSDFVIAISWRWLIHTNNARLIVFHDSILPRYRGFAPLVNMLLNKEPEIGVSAIFASEEYDKGDIIAQSTTPVSYPIKIKDAIQNISGNYAKLALYICNEISNKNTLIGTPQDERLATYSLWRNEDDYFIDWQMSSDEILNHINAVSSPYKGASTYIKPEQKIRILDAESIDDVSVESRAQHIGKVIFVKDRKPVIICGKGLLKITQAIYDDSQSSALPFPSFRIRLRS